MIAQRVFFTGRREPRKGHAGYLNFGSRSRTVDNQEEVVNAVLQERARRALYASCDRAPLGWEEKAA